MSLIYSFKNADIAFGTKTVLSNITWDIYKGRHTWISGDNASGKTMLCQAIAGKCRVFKGNALPVHLEYSDIRMVSFTDDGKLFHSVNNVHYYQQRFNSWDADGFLTASDYLQAKGVNTNTRENKTFLDHTGLTPLLNTERIKLSSGQTRKLLLASALLSSPKLLILDNPHIGLDTASRNYLNDFLDNIVHQRNITLIFSGQAVSLPKSIEDRIHINNGSLEIQPSIEAPKFKFKASNQLLENIRKINQLKSAVDYSGEILNLENISIKYGASSILENINWNIQSGERWSLYGPNGSGKSTLVSIIYADHPQAYSQNIRIFNKAIGVGRSIWEIKKDIGFTSPELQGYFRTDLTVEEVIYTGLFDKFEIMGMVHDHSTELAGKYLEYFEMSELADQPYSAISTGQQRVCLLIRALIKHPRLLLLDEPFQGMDERNVTRSKHLLDKLIDPGQTLIFISHFEYELPSCITHYFNL